MKLIFLCIMEHFLLTFYRLLIQKLWKISTAATIFGTTECYQFIFLFPWKSQEIKFLLV